MKQHNDYTNISEDEFDTIDRYLSGEMEMPEKMDFENRLQKEQTLKDRVEEFRTLSRGVEQATLNSKLDDFHHELLEKEEGESKDHVFSRWSLTQYAVAASVIFFIVIGSWWIISTANQDERLFAQYFKPDPGLATMMSVNNDYDFYVAMIDYKRGEYDEAIRQWSLLLNKRPASDTLHYFIGVAHLASGNETEAISFLKEATMYPESVFLDDAYYYLGLSHLKNGNIEKAKEAFEKSSVENSKLILSEMKD